MKRKQFSAFRAHAPTFLAGVKFLSSLSLTRFVVVGHLCLRRKANSQFVSRNMTACDSELAYETSTRMSKTLTKYFALFHFERKSFRHHFIRLMFAWKRVYVGRTSLCLAIGDVSDGDLCTQMWNDTVSTSIFIYTNIYIGLIRISLCAASVLQIT